MRNLLVCSVLVACSAVAPMQALECIDVPLKDAMALADVVLLGRVIEARYAMVSETNATHSVVTVQVDQLWKGVASKQIQLYQPFVGGGIDYHQSIGANFVVFAEVLTAARTAARFRFNPPNDPTGFTALECLTRRAHPNFVVKLGKGRPPEN